MTTRTAALDDIARGIVLVGVFHVHAVHAVLAHLADPDTLQLALLQVKLLTPHVVLFFALSGMTSKALPDKSLRHVISRCALLLLVAIFSHVVGVLITHALWQPWTPVSGVLKEIVKPIVLGTGHSTYVAWFFVALAATRLFAFLLATNLRHFMVAVTAAVAGVTAAMLLQLPDNLYEWRSWPAALLMFLLGTRVAQGWRVPHVLGVPAAAATFALALINRPELLTEGICIDCDLEFIAHPMIGGFGVMPVYLVQELLALVGLLWLCRLVGSTRLGHALAWMGRRSIKMLVLHGWSILSVYGIAGYIRPSSGGVWLFVAIFIVNMATHVLLYKLLSKPLNRFMLSCSKASRRLVAAISSAARIAGPRVTPPPRQPATPQQRTQSTDLPTRIAPHSRY